MKQSRILAICYLSIAVLGASCGSGSHTQEAGGSIDKSEATAEAPREEAKLAGEGVTGILGSFEQEIALLEDRLVDKKDERIEGMKFASGKLNGRETVIAWTGVGKVNAAMTTTLLIEHFRPAEVIFTGIAGAVNEDLGPGDLVIARKTAHHDSGVFRSDGFYYRGARNPMDGWRNPVFFEADERLLKIARQASKRVKFGTINTTTGERAPEIIEGIIVTGDSFIASSEKCAELREKLGADAVEMEGAAVAQICYQQATPCLVIRSISDSADEGAIQDSQMFYIMAAQNSSSLVEEIVGLLAAEASAEKDEEGSASVDE